VNPDTDNMGEDTEPQEPPDEEVLDISLDAEELAPVDEAAPAGDEGMLVIEADDLLDIPDEPVQPAAPTAYPAVDAVPEAVKLGPSKKALVAPNVMSVVSMALAGAIGGFIAWLLSEPFTTDLPVGATPAPQTLVSILAEMGLFGACLGGMIGMALGSVDGINSRVWEKAGLGALLGLAIGGAGGFLGGVFGQLVYGGLGGGNQANLAVQVLVRGLGWAMVGLFVGLGQGVLMRARRRIVNGLLGGLIGGLAGGLLFDPISGLTQLVLMLFGGTAGGELSRLVAIVMLGLACGVAIGFVEQMRKEAWLRITGGALMGKEFIIYRSPTIIGSSPKCDITLAMDKQVAPQHASISEQGGRYLLSDMGTSGGTAVNGRPIRTHSLRSGDRITIGQTTLQYADRAIADSLSVS